MALSEFEARRCEKLLGEFIERRRPPAHLRDEVDLGFRVAGQSVEIFECRASRDRSAKTEVPAAKATFNRTRNCWKVFWMKSDLKWHGYGAQPAVRTFEEFLSMVESDPHGCFFG